MTDLSLFATVPRGLESLLAGELRNLGAAHVKQVRAGVAFGGSLETAYRTCLWSRVAGRVLLPVTSGAAADGDELYKTAQSVDWSRHLGVDDTLAVDFTGVNDRIRDTRFGGVRIKDAIVDQFRATSGGKRPSVDARAPDVRVNAHLSSTRVAISIDLSGQSLHRRGYRAEKVQVEAPLKENLAAGLLLYAAWPGEAAAGASLLDPLCGSGTLLIEAALMAADVAPGLLRAEAEAKPGAAPAFGFLRWRQHDADLWNALLLEARERRGVGIKTACGGAPRHGHPRLGQGRARREGRARLREARRAARPRRDRPRPAGHGHGARGARPARHQCPVRRTAGGRGHRGRLPAARRAPPGGVPGMERRRARR